MDFITIFTVSALLLLAAVVMMISHIRAWRSFKRQDADAEDAGYRWRQFRRRMQMSAMLGMVAIAVPVGFVLSPYLRSGWFDFVYWIATMLVVCWIILLAAVDIWATKYHFGRLHQKCLIERAKLEAEARRVQAVKGNGKAKVNGD
jgi:hypothetical protein